MSMWACYLASSNVKTKPGRNKEEIAKLKSRKYRYFFSNPLYSLITPIFAEQFKVFISSDPMGTKKYTKRISPALEIDF